MALTRNICLRMSAPDKREERTLDVAASTTIYNGMICCLDTSENVVEAADTANYVFGGIALEYVDNSAGAAGAKHVRLMTAGRVVVEGNSTLAGALGQIATASDGDTVSDAGTTTNDIAIGRVTAVEDVNDPESRSNAVELQVGHGTGSS